jgi:hypothetical protein
MTDRTRLTPGQELTKGFPVVGERAPAPGGEWELVVEGLVEHPLRLSLPELLDRPQVERTWDTVCVTGWTHLDHRWRGVLLRELLDEAGPLPEARFVRFVARSVRDHDTSMPLDFAREHVLLAHAVDGGPLRSVCEGKYFYKSVKWLVRIELLAEDRLGYWERASSYHNGADPRLEQRYQALPMRDEDFARAIRERDFSGMTAILDEQFKTLRGMDLSGVNFEGAQIKGCPLSRLKLARLRARGANFTKTDFVEAELTGADFRDADLEGANFRGADLTGADFRGAALTQAKFARRYQDARVRGARFLRADVEREGVQENERAFLLDPANGAVIE